MFNKYWKKLTKEMKKIRGYGVWGMGRKGSERCLNKDHVEFAQVDLLAFGQFRVGGCLDYERHDVLLYALALLAWQHFPARFDNLHRATELLASYSMLYHTVCSDYKSVFINKYS